MEVLKAFLLVFYFVFGIIAVLLTCLSLYLLLTKIPYSTTFQLK